MTCLHTLEEMEAAVKRARAALHELCITGARSFHMSIPVRNDDTDMVISSAFDAADELIARLRKLQPVPVVLVPYVDCSSLRDAILSRPLELGPILITTENSR